MLKNKNTNTNATSRVASLALLGALALAPLGASADDGAYGVAVASTPITDLAARPMTCKQAIDAAWFERELERSDGSVIPALDTPQECERRIYAAPEGLTPWIRRREEDGQRR